MRIRTTKTKNGRLFYVIKTYYDSKGIEHSMTVEKLGNENDIRAKYGRDPEFATQLVIFTTLCSIPAIFLWSMLLTA